MTKRNASPDGDDLLTPAIASSIAGVSTMTLARMADRGELTVSKPAGTHRRYRRAEVEALARPVTIGGTR